MKALQTCSEFQEDYKQQKTKHLKTTDISALNKNCNEVNKTCSKIAAKILILWNVERQ